MITPKLEELILKGDASYKTFVAGGGTKSVLQIPINRWVVITDFVVYSFLPDKMEYTDEDFADPTTGHLNGIITQMSIFSNKSLNTYVFRNNVNWVPLNGNVFAEITGSQRYDCYLIHEESIVFNFLRAENNAATLLTTTDAGFTPADSIGVKPPIDYGKAGLPGSIVVPRIRNTGILPGEFRAAGGVIDNTTNPSFTQLQFPVNAATDFSGESGGALQFPIVNIGYVEIFGKWDNSIQPS